MSSKVQSSLRFNRSNYDGIRAFASESGKDFSTVANDLLEEAIKMRRCPGIIFGEGITGRRARIAGTGIDVWEVIRDFHGMGNSFDELRETYHWLTEKQVRAALAYYRLYPDEINERIQRNADITPESLAASAPYFARP